MLENEELGLKVAENEEEAFWQEIIDSTKKDIERLEKLLKFNKAVLELAENKINAIQKN